MANDAYWFTIGRMMAAFGNSAKPPFDFSEINRIDFSDWTGDYFIMDGDIQGQWHVSEDWPPDDELYQAITELVKSWDMVEATEQNMVVYTRPKE